MNSIGANIKKLRDSRGMTQQQLADVVGAKTYTTVTKWEKGDNVPQGKDLIVLSDFFGVSVDSILGINKQVADINFQTHNFVPTPISAGLPLNVEATTNLDTISIPDGIMGKWAGNKDIYFMRINGDSMDKVMPDQSLIAIKPINLSELKNGDMVVFSNDYEYSVKYYQRNDDKLIFKPSSTNPVHYDQIYSTEDNITIHGKVVLYIVEMD